jgi:hypothetical protein
LLYLVAQGLAFDELHYEVGSASVQDTRVVNRHDVGVFDSPERNRLSFETLEADRIGRGLGANYLERYGPFQIELCGTEDGAHGAHAEKHLYLVLSVDEMSYERFGFPDGSTVARTDIHALFEGRMTTRTDGHNLRREFCAESEE